MESMISFTICAVLLFIGGVYGWTARGWEYIELPDDSDDDDDDPDTDIWNDPDAMMRDIPADDIDDEDLIRLHAKGDFSKG